MTLVDTNILLDVVTDDPAWADCSIAQLEAASLDGPLLINDTVYAELAVRYDRIEELEAFLDEAGLEMTAMPRAALFPCRQDIYAVSPRRRIKDWRIARLFHRCPCSG
ncbi:hypothetical protein IE4872_PD01710 (plasmid) [Rhizobium gallicum]|uniref:PilT domain-containing protein n=1 Tax=Rhizobium gallicum TaxID=56730 RepID=A0A1L5NWF5_9HYPH|nr:hypothetical protein IE4872_PD01710 [Rhizobium gallicum]